MSRLCVDGERHNYEVVIDLYAIICHGCGQARRIRFDDGGLVVDDPPDDEPDGVMEDEP